MAKGKNESERAKYAEKIEYSIQKTVINAVFTVWGYQVLKKTDFLPWFMGGISEVQWQSKG